MKLLAAGLVLAIAVVAQTLWMFPPGSARANLSAAFFEFQGMDAASTADYLEELHGLGIQTLVTVGTRTKADCASSNYDWAGTPQMIGQVLGKAQTLGMKVYLGLIDTEACDDWTGDAGETARLVEEILATFGGYSSLAGWYLPDEPYIQDDRWLSGQATYFASLVAAVRQHSQLPITVSPYLVSDWSGSPAVAGDVAARFLALTGIDILIYQDGAGTRKNDNIQWRGVPSIADYFRTISLYVGRDHLWALHELFNCPFGVDGGFGSITIAQLDQQIGMVSDDWVSGRMTWTNQEWMTAVSPTRHPDAARLLAGYRATHFGQGRLVKPVAAYFYGISAVPSNILWDGVTGDPFSPNGPDWGIFRLGPAGTVSMTLDLGGFYTVDYLSLQVAKQAGAPILPPRNVVGNCYGAGGQYSILLSTFGDIAGFNGQETMANVQPAGAGCRYLDLEMTAASDIHIGELEIIARN